MKKQYMKYENSDIDGIEKKGKGVGHATERSATSIVDADCGNTLER